MKKNCEYSGCKKEFEAKRADKKFCSSTCRSKHTHLNAAKRELAGDIVPSPAQHTLGSNMQIPPHAQFMVDFQTKEAKRWEEAFNKEREASIKLKELNETLSNDLRELKTQQQIKESSVPVKSTLDGIKEIVTDENTMKYLGPIIGPHLGKLIEKVTGLIPGGSSGAPVPEISGIDLETQNKAVQMINWYAQLPKEGQDLFYTMVDKLAAHQDAAPLIAQLRQLLNLVSKTSMNPGSFNQNYAAHANY